MLKHSLMFDYISGFGKQLLEGSKISESPPLANCDFQSVILCGMGGSAIGGDLLTGYCAPLMKIPFVVNRGYQIPAWVDENTLAIFSSYSGNTGETLSCFEHGVKRGAHALAVTSGGKLEELCSNNDVPCLKIPGGLPPRAALGYSFAPLYTLFKRIGLTEPPEDEFDQAVGLIDLLRADYSKIDSAPGQLAHSIRGKTPVFYVDGYRLSAVVSRFRTQLAENAKTLAFGNVFPELNHNEIVGWGIPNNTVEDLIAVFLWDSATDERVNLQMQAMKEIIEKIGVKVYDIKSTGEHFLSRMLSLIHFADWLSYHLSVINGVDPIPIERIDELKEKLREREEQSDKN